MAVLFYAIELFPKCDSEDRVVSDGGKLGPRQVRQMHSALDQCRPFPCRDASVGSPKAKAAFSSWVV